MSTAMRTPQKVQSLRTHEIDAGDKTAGSQSHLARAVTLHLAGRREEALKQLQRAIAANEASAEIYRAMGHIQFELGSFDEAAKSYRILVQVKPQFAPAPHDSAQQGVQLVAQLDEQAVAASARRPGAGRSGVDVRPN